MLPHKWCWVVMGQDVENVLPHVSYAPGEEERRANQCRNETWWCTFLANQGNFVYRRNINKSVDMCPRYGVSASNRHMSSRCGSIHSSPLILSWGTKKTPRQLLYCCCCLSITVNTEPKTRARNWLSLLGGLTRGIFCCLLEGDGIKKFVDAHRERLSETMTLCGYIISFLLISFTKWLVSFEAYVSCWESQIEAQPGVTPSLSHPPHSSSLCTGQTDDNLPAHPKVLLKEWTELHVWHRASKCTLLMQSLEGSKVD